MLEYAQSQRPPLLEHRSQRLTRPSLACTLPRRRSWHLSRRPPLRPPLACRRACPSRRLLSLVRCGTSAAAGEGGGGRLTDVHTRRSGQAGGFSLPSAWRGFSRGRDCSGVLQAVVVPWRGAGGAGGGVRLWDIILWSGTLLRTALAYVEPKGRDKVEAMSSYVTTSHVDLPCHFSSSAFAHASFPLPSFLPPSIHPRHLALIHAGIGTLSSARTLSHVGPRKV